MANRVSIGEHSFIVLSDAEAGCDHDWQDYEELFCINSKREYVIGYGRQSVSVPVKVGVRCSECGRVNRLGATPSLKRTPVMLSQEEIDALLGESSL